MKKDYNDKIYDVYNVKINQLLLFGNYLKINEESSFIK